MQMPPQCLYGFCNTRQLCAVPGIKHPPHWLFPLRLYRLLKARPYVTTFSGLDRPWRLIEPYLDGLRVTPVMLGSNYLAAGRARG